MPTTILCLCLQQSNSIWGQCLCPKIYHRDTEFAEIFFGFFSVFAMGTSLSRIDEDKNGIIAQHFGGGYSLKQHTPRVQRGVFDSRDVNPSISRQVHIPTALRFCFGWRLLQHRSLFYRIGRSGCMPATSSPRRFVHRDKHRTI